MAEYEFDTEEERVISVRTTNGRLKFRTDEAKAKELYAEMKGISLEQLETLNPEITIEKGLRPCLKKLTSKNLEKSSTESSASHKSPNAKV